VVCVDEPSTARGHLQRRANPRTAIPFHPPPPGPGPQSQALVAAQFGLNARC